MAARRKRRRQPPRWARIAVIAVLAGGCIAAMRSVPAWLDDSPPVDPEVEALARVIRSEMGVGSRQQQLHVAWATRNLAAERDQSVAQMACSPCGPQDGSRPVSSRQEATDDDRALARHVLATPPAFDPTGGATHYINPRLQDELAERGRAGYQPYRRVRKRWIRTYGWRPYYRLGDSLELWGPKPE